MSESTKIPTYCADFGAYVYGTSWSAWPTTRSHRRKTEVELVDYFLCDQTKKHRQDNCCNNKNPSRLSKFLTGHTQRSGKFLSRPPEYGILPPCSGCLLLEQKRNAIVIDWLVSTAGLSQLVFVLRGERRCIFSSDAQFHAAGACAHA